ncbi:hypothetical protein ACWEOZ_28715 [Actinoplanes sp. NPDC004185]
MTTLTMVLGQLHASPAPPADPFWQRFMTSAGFGGLMALAAALVAARIAAAQLRHTKSQQQLERWWSTLTWVYDRAIVEQDKRAALPDHVTFAMLSQLAERVQTPPGDGLQQSTIRSILSMFEAAGDGARPGADDAVRQVSDPTAVALLDELRDRLSSDTELAALRYLHAAKLVVERGAAALGATTNDRGHGELTATWDGRSVLIRIRHAASQMPNAAVFLAVEQLETGIAADRLTVGGLLVLNSPPDRPALDAFLANKHRPGLEVVVWREEADDRAVQDALRRLRPP